MGYKLTFNHPAYPKDTEFEVAGIGVLKNGVAEDISEDREREYITTTQQTIKEGLKQNDMLKVEGTTTVSGGVKAVLGIDPAQIDSEVVVVAEEPTTTTKVVNS